jgi:glycosyltransferase involved in cell wall biosynthesis
MNKYQKNNKKKVFFLIPSFRGGGEERVVLNIVNNLDKDKFEVGLITISGEGEYKGLLSSEVNYFDLQRKRARNAIFKLRRLLKEEAPDVIVTSVIQTAILLYLSCLFILNKKMIKINRLSSYYEKIINNTNMISRLFFNKALKNSDYVISLTEEMKENFIKFFPSEKNKVIKIYNPHNLEDINNKKHYSISLEERNFFSRKPVIIACGRLTEAKGFSYLIQAFNEVKKEFKDAILLILGQGEKEKELKVLVKELNIENSVKFLGFKDNPYKYLYNSDLFVLSSLWEGLPGVLIEALACQVPVVSTNCKSGPKEILDNGKIGELVKIKDVDSLSNAILKVLRDKDLQHKYKELGLKKVKEFDKNKIIKEYEEFLSYILL